MILATTNLYSHLVKYAHTRGGFAGVEHLCVEVCNAICIDSSLGSYATHTLHNVEQDSLCLKK